jgi:hypothetical protein
MRRVQQPLWSDIVGQPSERKNLTEKLLQEIIQWQSRMEPYNRNNRYATRANGGGNGGDSIMRLTAYGITHD